MGSLMDVLCKQVWGNLYYKESECDICAIGEFCIQKKEG